MKSIKKIIKKDLILYNIILYIFNNRITMSRYVFKCSSLDPKVPKDQEKNILPPTWLAAPLLEKNQDRLGFFSAPPLFVFALNFNPIWMYLKPVYEVTYQKSCRYFSVCTGSPRFRGSSPLSFQGEAICLQK
ncbi:MAG: hypothetical protein WD426_08245 [Anditalea sp.]